MFSPVSCSSESLLAGTTASASLHPRGKAHLNPLIIRRVILFGTLGYALLQADRLADSALPSDFEQEPCSSVCSMPHIPQIPTPVQTTRRLARSHVPKMSSNNSRRPSKGFVDSDVTTASTADSACEADASESANVQEPEADRAANAESVIEVDVGILS